MDTQLVLLLTANKVVSNLGNKEVSFEQLYSLMEESLMKTSSPVELLTLLPALPDFVTSFLKEREARRILLEVFSEISSEEVTAGEVIDMVESKVEDFGILLAILELLEKVLLKDDGE